MGSHRRVIHDQGLPPAPKYKQARALTTRSDLACWRGAGACNRACAAILPGMGNGGASELQSQLQHERNQRMAVQPLVNIIEMLARLRGNPERTSQVISITAGYTFYRCRI